jgi:hypothetical protein
VNVTSSSLASLQELTVPPAQRPPGCAATPVAPKHAPDDEFSWLLPPQVRTNPWIGSDKTVLAEIRARIDPPLRAAAPDGPPIARAASAEFAAHLADDVEEGYAAAYGSPDGPAFPVWAVRFAPGADRLSAGRLDAPANVIDAGTVRVMLPADASACARAVAAYVRTVLRR